MDSIRMHWGHFREWVRGVNVQLAHMQQNAPWIHERLLSSLYLKITLELAHSYSIKHCGSASHYFLLMFLLISQIKSTWLKTESSSATYPHEMAVPEKSAPFCSCSTASGAALKQEWQMASKWMVQIVRFRLQSARSIRGEITEMRYATSREGDGSPLLWQRSLLSFQHHGQQPANISTADSAADPPSVRAPGLDVRSVERHRMQLKSHLSRTVWGSEGKSYKLKVPDDWANSTCLWWTKGSKQEQAEASKLFDMLSVI